MQDCEAEGGRIDPGSLVARKERILVWDTNVLIDDWEDFVQISQLTLSSTTLSVVPWQVVKELERSVGKLHLRARCNQISRSLALLLKEPDSSVICQRLSETELGLKRSDHSADDQILDCCLYFRKHFLAENGGLVLVTKDANLALKAASHSIDCCSLLKEEKRVIFQGVLFAPERKRHKKAPKKSKSLIRKRALVPRKKLSEVFRMKYWNSKGSSMRELREFSREWVGALSLRIQSTLQRSIGELWIETVAIRPPWNVCTLSQLLVKQSAQIFNRKVSSSIKKSLEGLCSFLRKNWAKDDFGTASEPEIRECFLNMKEIRDQIFT